MTNIANLHVPERLDGETVQAYRLRRKWSKTIAAAQPVITPAHLGHRTDALRKSRRDFVKAVGIRQFKRRGIPNG